MILKRFNKETIPENLSDSDSSALSADNWRKTERLLREVVKDRRDPRAEKLSREFHRLSVQKSLLAHEAQGFRQAVINERLRRKRGKPLLLEPGEEYHSGAVFWSPKKVKEAHIRRQELQRQEEQQQLEKAERARIREEKKKLKLQAIKKKRAGRVAAGILERAPKATSQAARAATRRAQQRLQPAQKTSQRSKARSLINSAKAASKKRARAQADSHIDGIGPAAGPAPSQSRHGRAIKLPAKYR
jgi:hypothetical protein